MYKLFVMGAFIMATNCIAQKSNFTSNPQPNIKNKSLSIEADGANNIVEISTKVIYNALPDGYLATFNKTWVGNTVEQLEKIMYMEMDQWASEVKKDKITTENIVMDVVSLDPIYNFKLSDTLQTWSGYKMSQNVTFKIKDMKNLRLLLQSSLKYKNLNLVTVEAFVHNSSSIQDSLSKKAVEILNKKKQFCVQLGWSFSDGKPSFENLSQVLYPNDRYIKTHIYSDNIYKNHLEENSEMNYSRNIHADKYFNLNLKDADYVFNSDEKSPVIQFHFILNYSFTARDREREKEAKEAEEKEYERNKNKKSFYMMDEKGQLKKVNI